MANNPRQNYPVPAEMGGQYIVQQPDPGAGVGFIFSLPQILSEWRYRVQSVKFTCVLDATVANRWLGLRIFRHTNPYYMWYAWPFSGVQVALSNVTYEWSPSIIGQYNSNGFYYESFPAFEWDTWHKLGQTTQNYQAGDVTSNIWITMDYNYNQTE